MKLKCQNLNGLLGLVVLLYPILVFVCVIILKVPINRLSIFIMAFAVVYFLVLLNAGHKKLSMFISPALLILIGLAGFFLDSRFMIQLFPQLEGKSDHIIKLYPVLADSAYIIIFFTTIINPPTLAFDIALLLDKSIKDSPAEKPMTDYCRKASIAWCIFFIFDTIIAIVTMFVYPDDEEKAYKVWTLYNGGVSYILIGIMFVIQFIDGKLIIKKYNKQKETEET